MSTVVIIPARLASTRLANKPLADIKGKPMIVRVFEQAKKADIGDVVVATCSPSIKELIEAEGGACILTNPDHPSGSDRIWEVVQGVPTKPDYIVNLQGDLPFINPDDIQHLAKLLHQNVAEVVTLAAPISEAEKIHNPNVVKIAGDMTHVDNHHAMLKCHYFSRSAIPHGAQTFYEHVGIYGYSYKALESFVNTKPSYLELTERLEQLRLLNILNTPICAHVIDHPPLSIDTADDLAQANR